MSRKKLGASAKADRAAAASQSNPQAVSIKDGIPRAASFEARFHGKGLSTRKRSGAEIKQTRKLRALLVEDQGGRCFFCRRMLTDAKWGVRALSTDATVEHLVPRALGGALSHENCVACCHACNKHRNCIAYRRKIVWRYRIADWLRHLSGWADERAQAIEARRAETGADTGSVHESAVPEGNAPEPSSTPSSSTHPIGDV